MIVIKELEWKNFLGSSKVHLKFQSTQSTAYVVHYKNNCPLKGTLLIAVQMICSSKYLTMESLKPFLQNKIDNNQSYVRLLLEQKTTTTTTAVTTSENDKEEPYKLEVWRYFGTDTKHIVYCLNDGENKIKCTLPKFHGMFKLNADYLFSHLGMSVGSDAKLLAGNFDNCNWQQILCSVINNNDTEMDINGNVLNALFKRIVNVLTNLNKNNDKEKYMEACHDKEEDETTKNLIKHFISIKKVTNGARKQLLLNILKYIRSYFEYFTFYDYTIYFLIPYGDKVIDIKDIQLTDMDFTHMKTCIQPYKDTNYVNLTYKNSIEGAIASPVYELLLIALQFSLALNINQRFIYISNIKKLHQSMCMDMVSKDYRNNNCVKIFKNYIQRIANCANHMKAIVMIDIPGCLLMPIKNSNIIFCHDNKKCSSSSLPVSWNMEVEK